MRTSLYIYGSKVFPTEAAPSAHESVLLVGQEEVIHPGLSQCLWQGWWWELQLLQALRVCPVMSQSWAGLVPSCAFFQQRPVPGMFNMGTLGTCPKAPPLIFAS